MKMPNAYSLSSDNGVEGNSEKSRPAGKAVDCGRKWEKCTVC
jgi:hypothetical protein